jgi:hypothetical protein
VDRYFSFLAVELTVMLLLTIVPVLTAHPRLGALVIANALLYTGWSSLSIARYQGWAQDAPIVARLAAQCPGTRIHAGSNPPDPAEQIGLVEIAAKYKLTLLPLAPDTPGPCPVLYWTEYRPPKRGHLTPAAANAAAGFGLGAEALRHSEVVKTKFGIILVEREGK